MKGKQREMCISLKEIGLIFSLIKIMTLVRKDSG